MSAPFPGNLGGAKIRSLTLNSRGANQNLGPPSGRGVRMLIERHLMSNIRKSLAAARNDEGFKLVELLIVIVVLGILASIVVFGVATFRSDAQTAACKADLKTVSVAADAYNAKTGAYPAGADDAARIGVLTAGGYLKSAPAAASAVALSAAGVVTSSVAGCTI
jgi:prepilin-type N-terminal cleavage/methylation domain-containing protein